MGFVTVGKRYHSGQFSDTQVRNRKYARTHNSHGVIHRKRKVILKDTAAIAITSHKRSILERLPLELLYEIYLHSQLGKLNLTNRYFHTVLSLHSNQYLLKKLISYNIYHNDEDRILNIKLLNLKSILKSDLDVENISCIDFIDDMTRVPKCITEGSLSEYDLPQRYYYPTTDDDFDMIEYLQQLNLKYMNINKVLQHLIESDSIITQGQLGKVLSKSELQLDDIEPLMLSLTKDKMDIAKWLMQYYDHSQLQDNKLLWAKLMETKSYKLLKFFLSYDLSPQHI